MPTRRTLAGLLAGTALGAPRPGRAQAPAPMSAPWPERPVRIVIPYAPGGANDILARLYGARMAERFGQPFVPENRAGAQAIVGTEAVARARPDGHTLLMGASGPMVFNPATYDRLPYDTLRDFAPISLLASFAFVVIVAAGSPHRTLADLIAWARANPERANYSSSGAASQLPSELFNQLAGTRFQMVGYRGGAEVVSAVAAGEVTMSIAPAAPAAPAIAAGRVRVLATTAPRRQPSMPDVPTMAEAGFPDVTLTPWSGLLAPAGTPQAVVQRIADAAVEITREAEVGQRLAALGLDPVGSRPEEFAAQIAREIALWTRVARAADIRLER